MALKCQRPPLPRAIGFEITVDADPALLECPLNVIRAWAWLSRRSRDQHGEGAPVVVARMAFWHADRTRHADAEVAQIDVLVFVFFRVEPKKVIVVGET